MKKVITKITAVALALIVAASLFTSAFAALRGDVDLNGKVNSLDALRILRYSVKIDTEINEKIADVNGDGKINSLDALGVLRINVGLDAGGEVEEDEITPPSSKAEIVEFYNDTTEIFTSLADETIINHRKIEKDADGNAISGVYCTTYSDGTEIYVNYSGNIASTPENIAIGPYDYVRVKR